MAAPRRFVATARASVPNDMDDRYARDDNAPQHSAAARGEREVGYARDNGRIDAGLRDGVAAH